MKVVIIGGGFLGMTVAKELEEKFDVTLIDRKNFFEFTPGILRAIVEPHHLSNLQKKHTSYLKKTTIVKDEVKKVTKNQVIGKSKKYPFDYLVIASGSSYAAPIKSHNLINSSNAQVLQKSSTKLKKAKNVLVVGGGIVGVELAAEIAEKYQEEIKRSNKEIVLVHSKKQLMPRENDRACNYAYKQLRKFGVNIHFEKRFEKDDSKEYDLVFLSTGISPNTSYLQKSMLDERKFVVVKDTLQVKGHKNVFAGGDLIHLVEEKLAQTAEHHGKIIVHNIEALENKQSLKEYNPKAKVKLISLGTKKGILTYKGFTMTGYIPGFLKNFFEWYFMKTL